MRGTPPPPPGAPVTGPVGRGSPPGGKGPARKSVADDIASALAAIGARLSRVDTSGAAGKHYALGQYLQMSGPASGEVIDGAVKGTVVDRRVLQPLSRGKDRIGAVSGVVLPPLLIFAIEERHDLAPQLIPLLALSIENSLDSMLPAKKKADERAARRAKAVAEAFGETAEPGVDPVMSIIVSMFPWAFVETAPEEDRDVVTV